MVTFGVGVDSGGRELADRRSRAGRPSVSAAALSPASKTNSGAAFIPCPAARGRRSTFFTCRIVCAVRVAGTVRATSARAAHAVRRCPMAAVSWYSSRARSWTSPGSDRRRCGRAPGPGSITRPAGDRRSRRPRTGAGPPGARVPHLRGNVRRQPGQHFAQQAVVDHVVRRDPRAGLRPADGLRQFRCQRGEEPLVVDSPGGQRVVQRAVAAGELRLLAQLHQRRHGVIGAQDRAGQLEQGVRARVQAFI